MRTGNRVLAILTDRKGNTIGAEIRTAKGDIICRSTDSLIDRHYKFDNAILDKNGFVRGKDCKLIKKVYTKPTNNLKTPKITVTDTTKKDLDTLIRKSNRAGITKLSNGFRFNTQNNDNKQYIILIEDSGSGFALYSYLLFHWFRAIDIDNLGYAVSIVTSSGKNNILNILSNYMLDPNIIGCLVVMDKLGEYIN